MTSTIWTGVPNEINRSTPKWAASVATTAVAGFVLLRLFEGPNEPAVVFFVVAAVAVGFLLTRLYRLVSREGNRSHSLPPCGGGLGWGEQSEVKSTPTLSSPIEGEEKNGNDRERLPREVARDHGAVPREARAHLLLHVFPLTWLTLQFVVPPSRELNLLFFAPVALFFWTGRRTWQGMNKRYPSLPYRFFVKGNTGFLISVTVFSILGLAYDPVFGHAYFRTVLMMYLVGHLLVTGPSVLKIERDLVGGIGGASIMPSEFMAQEK